MILNLHTYFNYLRVEAHSAGDTTLAIVAPDGNVWCDDDGAGGLNSRIAGSIPPGTYQIYVGSYHPGQLQFQLSFTEYQP